MSIAEVGTGSQRAQDHGSNVDTLVIAYPAAVTSGNLLIAAGSRYGVTVGTVVTSTRSAALTVIEGATGNGSGTSFLAYGIATSSGACTVTVNPSGPTTYTAAGIDEFSGVLGSPLDANGGETTGSSNTPTGAVTTGVANALVVAVAAGAVSPLSWAAGAGYTLFASDIDYASFSDFAAEFRIVTTAQAYAPSFTMGTVGGWTVVTASFAPAGVAPPYWGGRLSDMANRRIKEG